MAQRGDPAAILADPTDATLIVRCDELHQPHAPPPGRSLPLAST
jgi:hypothetical protein